MPPEPRPSSSSSEPARAVTIGQRLGPRLTGQQVSPGRESDDAQDVSGSHGPFLGREPAGPGADRRCRPGHRVADWLDRRHRFSAGLSGHDAFDPRGPGRPGRDRGGRPPAPEPIGQAARAMVRSFSPLGCKPVLRSCTGIGAILDRRQSSSTRRSRPRPWIAIEMGQRSSHTASGSSPDELRTKVGLDPWRPTRLAGPGSKALWKSPAPPRSRP